MPSAASGTQGLPQSLPPHSGYPPSPAQGRPTAAPPSTRRPRADAADLHPSRSRHDLSLGPCPVSAHRRGLRRAAPQAGESCAPARPPRPPDEPPAASHRRSRRRTTPRSCVRSRRSGSTTGPTTDRRCRPRCASAPARSPRLPAGVPPRPWRWSALGRIVTHARLSTKVSSWRRLRHSKAPSVYTA